MVSFENIFKQFSWGSKTNDTQEKLTEEALADLNAQELLSKTGKPTPKTYFHTHIAEGYDYSEGVKTHNRHDTISDFFSWSLFFPFEKMSNKLSDNEFISLTTDDIPNFKMTLMNEHATVHRITDRYRRAFVGRLPLDNADKLYTHHVPREFALGELAITHQLLQKISQLKLDFACLQLSETELAAKIQETLENNDLWQAKNSIPTNEIATRLAHSIARSFTLAFAPAIFRSLEYKQKNNQETNLELGFVLSMLDKLQSQSLLRYLKTKLAIFISDHKLPLPTKSFSYLNPEQVATIYQEISGLTDSPRTLIVPQATKGSSDPAYKDFFGSYFGSGELTYIATNGIQPEYQKIVQANIMNSNTKVSNPALAVLLADSYVPENINNPFRMLDHAEKPWVLGQITDQLNEENADEYVKKTKQSLMSRKESANRYAQRRKIWMVTHNALEKYDDFLGSYITTKRRIEELGYFNRWFGEVKDIVVQELGVQINNQAQLVFLILRGKQFENADQAKKDLISLLSEEKIIVDQTVIESLIELCQLGVDQSLAEDDLEKLTEVVQSLNN